MATYVLIRLFEIRITNYSAARRCDKIDKINRGVKPLLQETGSTF